MRTKLFNKRTVKVASRVKEVDLNELVVRMNDLDKNIKGIFFDLYDWNRQLVEELRRARKER